MESARSIVVAAVAVGLFAGCRTTQVVNEWTHPSASAASLKKVLVIAVTGEETTRRIAEDELAREFSAVNAVPSYEVIPHESLADITEVRRAIEGGDYDGVVMMRIIDVERTVTAVGVFDGLGVGPYDGFYSYYGLAYPPGYAAPSSTTSVQVETTVYELRDGADRLLWSGITESLEPRSVDALTRSVGRVVSRELREAGVIG